MESKGVVFAVLASVLSCAGAAPVSHAGVITPQDMEPRDKPSAQTSASAHETCLAILEDLAKAQSTAASLIDHNDLNSLTKLHDGVHDRVAQVREQMDRAILAGAWRNAAARIDALELLSRLEGIRILNRMNLAFLKGYPHATDTVSPSVADATQRMFSQIVILRDETRQLNTLSRTATRSATQR